MIWGVDKLISKQVDKLIVAIIMSFVKFVVVNGTYHKVQTSMFKVQSIRIRVICDIRSR